MIVGCPKEIMNSECRVGLTPDNAKEFVSHGHRVLIENNAGIGSGFSDEQYKEAGAEIVSSAHDVWDNADLIQKVKEPIEEEFDLLRPESIIYAYLHLANHEGLTQVLLDKKIKGVAFETITNPDGTGRPCLWPMSQIAGRLSIQEGAKYLERRFGGQGILLSGVPGVKRGNVVIIGGGMAGTYAAKAAVGIGANVTILDVDLNRLAYLEDIFGARVTTLFSSEANRAEAIASADVLVGSVLIPGAAAPKLVRNEHLKLMKKGSVIVDIAIDQGGCCESSHVTTHEDPIYEKDGVIHYCVGNMPGAVPYTSTIALTNAILNNALLIADNGLEQACKKNPGLVPGINTYDGKCVFKGVADAFSIDYTNIINVLS